MKKRIYAVSVLTLASVSCWGANKCVLSDGRVLYQDTPCSGATTATVVAKQAASDEQRLKENWDRELVAMRKAQDEFESRQTATRERRNAVKLKEKIKLDAFCGKLLGAEPAAGMTDKEFFDCSSMNDWGPRVARHEVTPFKYEVYYFPRKGRAVTIKDGKVTEVQTVSLGTVR